MKKSRTEEKTMAQTKYVLHIMKALGWYINNHTEVTQKKLAILMHVDSAVICRAVITPKRADEISEMNYKQKNIRLIDLAFAMEICEKMDTTLENVLYYYQHRSKLSNSTKIDEFEKLTKELMHSIDKKQQLNWPLADYKKVTNVPENKLIVDVNNAEFTKWFGRYYCYFSSTSSDEAGKKRKWPINRCSDDAELKELLECATDEYIFCGIMNIDSGAKMQDDLCHVDFKFLSDPEEGLIKSYSGILTLSSDTQAVFCELENRERGEKSYLILEKQDLGKPNIQCCMAMVLTYSSKVHRRRPCCERMILSKEIIKEGTIEYETMKAYLRMNDNVIRITEWGYGELLKDIRATDDFEIQNIESIFPDLESLEGNAVSIERCAFIPESVIYNLTSLTESQKWKFEILLRAHSIAPWYCKTKAIKADTLFKALKHEL